MLFYQRVVGPISTRSIMRSIWRHRDFASCVAILFTCLIFFAWACGKTFNLGDDANSLFFDQAPNAYKQSVTQFGWIWHPLFVLAGGRLALFRLFGASTLLLCALSFGMSLSRFLFVERNAVDDWSVIILAVTTAFWQYWLWLPTPSYNLLTLCGLLIFYAALLSSGAQRRRGSVETSFAWATLPAAVAGIALAVVTLAKPPSGALTALVGLGWIWAVGDSRPVLRILTTVVSSLLALWIITSLIDGNPALFMTHLRGALAALHARASHGSGNGIVDAVFGPLYPDRLWKAPLVLTLVACVIAPAAAWYSARSFQVSSRLDQYKILIVAIALATLLAISRAIDVGNSEYSPLKFIWFLTPPIAFVAITWYVASFQGSLPLSGWRRLAPPFLVAMAPVVYGFGTNSTLVRQMSGASVFMFAAIAMLADFVPATARTRFLTNTGLVAGACTVGILAGVSINPVTDGTPLWKQNQPISIGSSDSIVTVDKETAAYFNSLRAKAFAGGFKPKTPIFDFGNSGPGLVLAIGGTAPSLPWLTFGKASDIDYDKALLLTVPADVARRAWILTPVEFNEQRASQLTLLSLGLRFPQDYDLIAEARNSARRWSHALWKPRLYTH